MIPNKIMIFILVTMTLILSCHREIKPDVAKVRIPNLEKSTDNNLRQDWYYSKKTVTHFGAIKVFIELNYYVNDTLAEQHEYESQYSDTMKISAAKFTFYNEDKSKGFSYVFYPYYGLQYLAKHSYYENNRLFDSSYYFYHDSKSIMFITYNLKDVKEYLPNERYMEFPSPKPDTLPEFYKKLLNGCPYTPCTEIKKDK